jgi:hypothetical protein
MQADLSVNVNPFEVAMNPELMKLSESMTFAHVFSPALRQMHYAPVEQERKVDAALMGAISAAYPLRGKWDALVKKGVEGHAVKKYNRPNPWQNKGAEKAAGSGDSWLVRSQAIKKIYDRTFSSEMMGCFVFPGALCRILDEAPDDKDAPD